MPPGLSKSHFINANRDGNLGHSGPGRFHCEQAKERGFAPSLSSKPGSQPWSFRAACSFLDRTKPLWSTGLGSDVSPSGTTLLVLFSVSFRLSSRSQSASSLRAGPVLVLLHRPPPPRHWPNRVRLGCRQGPTIQAGCGYSLWASTRSICMLYGTRGSGSSEKKLFMAPATVFTVKSFSAKSRL